MPIVRLPTGELRDEIRTPIYDTKVIEAATSPVGTHQFFADVQGKSLIQTNLRQNKLLETAVSFRIQGFALDAQNDVPGNMRALPLLMERSSVQVIIGEKQYLQVNARYVAGRMWQDAYLGGGDDTILQQYGCAAVQPVVLHGKHVIDINPLQSFYVPWVVDEIAVAELASVTPAADTELRFMFSFKGLMRRPVQ